MDAIVKCTSITMAQFGTVQFQILRDNNPVTIVAIQFSEVKEAATFVHGELYNISIKQKT